jgi:hypothetical protein
MLIRVTDPDPFGSALILQAVSGSALKSKFRSFRGSKESRGGPWTLSMEAWRLKMKPWRVYRPVVIHFRHFDEEQDPDPQ